MKTLRTKPVYKVYFRYKNLTLWKNKSINKFTKKKWLNLQASKITSLQYNRGIYLFHYKKLNLTRLYYYKFINKQLFKKYLVNYTETSFKQILLNNFQNFEKRLDFNLYQANFVSSLYAARFYITKGYILVNKQIVTNFNFILKAHDLIEINPKFWSKNFSTLVFQRISISKSCVYYLRNIEIDYTTLSFIFLDHKQFYICQFDNFIKKIYFALLYKKSKGLGKKLNNINNYFNFFETTFNYYLFLDEYAKNFKIKTKITTLRVSNILKYLRNYYTDYFFRHIMLKRIFLYKYNYLKFITNSNIIDNKFNNMFENISNTFKVNNITNTSKNLLQFEYNKYIITIIFKFYIYLLKNYYITNYISVINNNSINNYAYILFDTKILLTFIRIKLVLTNYLTNKFLNNSHTNYIDIYKTNKYKLINTSALAIKINYPKTYMNWYKLQLLVYYISSTRFKYKIYRRCNSFKQNILKRYKILTHFRKAFGYRYYNQLCLGNSNLIYTRRYILNHLYHANKKNNTILAISDLKFINNIYYPKTSNLYRTIYKNLSNQVNITTNDIKNEINKIKYLLTNYQVSSKNSKILHNLTNKLLDKLSFFTTNRSYINFNYNQVYKNIFLLYNLIHTIIPNNINYNLSNLTYTFLYKVHVRNNYLYTKFNDIHAIKHYPRYSTYFNQRLKVNYYYINNIKSRSIFALNTKKYFLPLKRKTIHTNFIYIYNRYRKQRSKYFYKRFNMNNSSVNIINTKGLINNYFNMNIITKTFDFQDNLFYIDLLLNVSVRKINQLYNYTTICNKSLNSNNLIITLKNDKKLSLVTKNNYKYKKNYTFLSYISLYTYNRFKTFKGNINKYITTLKLKTTLNHNFIIYNINQNTYNLILLHKYFELKKYIYNNSINTNKILLNKNKFISNKYQLMNTFDYYQNNIRKYNLIKYLYKFYIFKEYNSLLATLLTTKNIKNMNIDYIKQLYYNLLFTRIFNFTQFDFMLKNNYSFSRNLRIMINYFIIIKRLYK